MLQEVMEHIHNYFIAESHTDTFTVPIGFSPSFLIEGQRFMITGSVLNDGVYTYHADGIKDDDDTKAVGLLPETFAGTICALAVPPAVIALGEEIKEWVANNGDTIKSPFTSESVLGVYSYTKATGGTGAGGTISWQDVFGSQLNRWRKVNFG